MTEGPGGRPTPPDPAEGRPPDHVQIHQLAQRLVPALAARLAASGLGEVEIREGRWKIRLRRLPPREGGVDGEGREVRITEGPAPEGEAGWPLPSPASPWSPSPSTASPSPSASSPSPSTPSSSPSTDAPSPAGWTGAATGGGEAAPLPAQPGLGGGEGGPGSEERIVATSPAVGYFSPRPDLRPGLVVRAGDPLGEVDVLGVGQEVAAPADGVVAATLVVAGQAVEYGQELVVLLPARERAPTAVAADAR